LYGWLDSHTVSKNYFRNPAVGTVAGAESKFTSLDGTRIHYARAGQGPATILFVHGWSCHGGFWREQAAALAPKARLLFVDLPGHGQSDKPQTEYSPDYFARAVLAVLKDAGAEKAILVGHSMGVPVICRVYAQAPEKVAGLVAIDGMMRRPSMNPEQLERLLARYRAADYKDHVSRFIGAMFPVPGTESLRDRVLRDMSTTPQHVMVAAFEGMFDAALPAWDIPKTEIPVLALQAPNPMWTAEYQEFVRGRSPLSDYRTVENTGHFLMLERPEEFNSALLDMLAKAKLIER
jgi:pimeloyl-ACP methyl ester carboxylesterase